MKGRAAFVEMPRNERSINLREHHGIIDTVRDTRPDARNSIASVPFVPRTIGWKNGNRSRASKELTANER